MGALDRAARAAFVDEVLRINQRYQTEVVERFDICPFAMGARTGGAFARRVLVDTTDPAGALAAVGELERDREITVALLICPCFAEGFEAFDAWVGALRRLDEARRPPPFALATFHPTARFRPETPQGLVMFFRRSPDPTVQLVRFDALDEIKRRAPGGKVLFQYGAQALEELLRRPEPISDRIARENHALVAREGLDRLQAIYDDIAADRARSYARFFPAS